MDESGVFTAPDGSEMAYNISGDGPIVVLIHGYGMTMDEWPSRMISGLESSFRVMKYNLRGVAGNTNKDIIFSISLASEDLYEMVMKVAGGPVKIVGYSMGGMIAQEFAISHPELAERIVLINTHCGGQEANPPEQWVLDEMASSPATIEEFIIRAGRLLLPEDWRKDHPEPMEWFPDFGEPSNQEAVAEQFEAMSSWEGSFFRLDMINSPVLVITGDMDIVTPPSNASILTSGIPDARHITIKGGGHGLIFQYPDDTAGIIRLFLEDE